MRCPYIQWVQPLIIHVSRGKLSWNKMSEKCEHVIKRKGCWFVGHYTVYTFSLLVVVCNTSTGGSMFPTSSFLSALIKLPKNAVCQVCQLWKWLLLLLDNETWVPYYLSCATRTGSMKEVFSHKNIMFRIDNWKLIWRSQFFFST